MGRASDFSLLSVTLIVAASAASVGFMFGRHFPISPAFVPAGSVASRTEPGDSGETPAPEWTTYEVGPWNIRFEYPETCDLSFMPMTDGLYLSSPESISVRECPFLGLLYYPERGPVSERVFPDGLEDAGETLREAEAVTVGGAPAISGIALDRETGKRSRNIYVSYDGRIYLLYYDLDEEPDGNPVRERIISSIRFPE